MNVVIEMLGKELSELEMKKNELNDSIEKAKSDIKRFEKELKKTEKNITVKRFDLIKDSYEENRKKAKEQRKEMKNYLLRQKTDEEIKIIKTLSETVSKSNEIEALFQGDLNTLTDALALLSIDQITMFKEKVSKNKELKEKVREESHLHYFLLETEIDRLNNRPILTKKLLEKDPKEQLEFLKFLKEHELEIERDVKEAENVTIGIRHLSTTLLEIQENMDLRKYFMMEDDELQLFIVNHKNELKKIKEYVDEVNKIDKAEKEKMYQEFKKREAEIKKNYLLKKETEEGKKAIEVLAKRIMNAEEEAKLTKEIYDISFEKDEVKQYEFTLLFHDALTLLPAKERMNLFKNLVQYDEINELFGSSDEIFELLNKTALENSKMGA